MPRGFAAGRSGSNFADGGNREQSQKEKRGHRRSYHERPQTLEGAVGRKRNGKNACGNQVAGDKTLGKILVGGVAPSHRGRPTLKNRPLRIGGSSKKRKGGGIPEGPGEV